MQHTLALSGRDARKMPYIGDTSCKGLASTVQPGLSSNDMTRRPSGKRTSSEVVGTFFSFGRRTSYFSHAPGELTFGETVTCAAAAEDKVAIANAAIRRLGMLMRASSRQTCRTGQ